MKTRLLLMVILAMTAAITAQAADHVMGRSFNSLIYKLDANPVVINQLESGLKIRCWYKITESVTYGNPQYKQNKFEWETYIDLMPGDQLFYGALARQYEDTKPPTITSISTTLLRTESIPIEEWKPFDEAVGDWYVYKDWYPVDDGHMRRDWRQDWRKGERCASGPSLGQERDVSNYYKERDEIIDDPVFWVEYDDLIRDWYDAGGWLPAADTIPYGRDFTQTKVQKQDREQGERCTVGPQKGATRNEKPYTKERIVTQEAAGTAEQWEAFDTLVRDWYDAGGWTPDAGTVLAGEAFTQTKSQAQDWRKGERCVIGPAPSAERNIESYSKSRSLTQSSVGTMEIWSPVYWWSEWYPISEWTPDAGLFLTTQTFEQTIRLKRDQYMREVSNIGNIRKDNTYIQSEYKSESRVVQGARQPEANVTIDTKAPEIEIQSNSTKGTGQYYIIPD